MTTSLVRTRFGTPGDLAVAEALHARCSPTSLFRRFHSPHAQVPTRVIRGTLTPEHGWSRLAEVGGEVVGIACAGPLSTYDLELGLLVEDAHHGRGIGARLLRDMATDATARGYQRILCLTQTGNDAVLGTVRRSGLPSTRRFHDGVMCVQISLAVDAGMGRPA